MCENDIFPSQAVKSLLKAVQATSVSSPASAEEEENAATSGHGPGIVADALDRVAGIAAQLKAELTASVAAAKAAIAE